MKTPASFFLKSALVLLVTLVAGTAIVSAQTAPSKYKVLKRKCVKVEIADPGEIYSTYTIEEEEIALMKEQKLKQPLITAILDNHTEETWPGFMKDLDNRIANPETIMRYNVYKVCTMGDRVVLVVPAKYNQHMPENWDPEKDFYIVFGTSGLQ